MKICLTGILVVLFTWGSAEYYPVSQIPGELLEDAYAVVRKDDTKVEFLKYNKVKITSETVVTVLNESGMKYGFFPVVYHKKKTINKFKATLYDAQGKEIKKLKKKDLKDISVFDGFSLFTDRRLQYYDIQTVNFPVTIAYELEVTTSNTAFFPEWSPVEGYNLSVENSRYELINSSGIEIRKKEFDLEEWDVEKEKDASGWVYSVRNIKPVEDEELSPPLSEFTPSVRFAPNHFELEGVEGRFNDWSSFGKWYYNSLLKGIQEIPEKDKKEALKLVEGISDTREKVRILYQYLQSKTRYVNVAIGIGGWEPFPASYVSEKSYGDCKALSNYMVGLLKLIGVNAYHTVVYGMSGRKKDMDEDFPAFEGNHMIVNVPMDDETIWLECTSQQTAFNHLGYFTDDRKAVSVGPEGGKIVETQHYKPEESLEKITGSGILSPDGKLTAEFQIVNSGLQYDGFSQIYFETKDEQEKDLKKYFQNLTHPIIKSYEFENDRDKAVISLNAEVESTQFAKVIGNNLVFNVVPVGIAGSALRKNKDRRFPFEIRFGYTDELQWEMKIPAGYKISEDFEPKIYLNKFGDYMLNVKEDDQGNLIVYRKLTVKDGKYPKEEYNDYVNFKRKISSMDNSKILIEKL